MSLLTEYHPLTETPLPLGWSEVPVGDIAIEIRSGYSSGGSNTSRIGIPHLRPMNVSAEGKISLADLRYVASTVGHLRLQDGDVLFTNTSSTVWVGKTAVVEDPSDWAFSNHMTRIRLHDEMVPRFFSAQLHLLCRVGYFAHHCTEHINQSSIAPSLLRTSIPVRVPPASEQNRILKRLDELQGQSERAKAHLAHTSEELVAARKAILSSAFSGELTREWRKNNRDSTKVGPHGLEKKSLSTITSPIENVPQEWTWVTLENVLKDKARLAYGILKPGSFVPNGVPMLRVTDIGDGQIDQRNIVHVAPKVAVAFKRTKLEVGDVVLAVMATIGRSAVVPLELSGANVNRALAVMRFAEGIDPHFASAYFRSPYMQERFHSEKVGVAQSRINLSELRQYPFPIPPLDEQREIVRQLDRELERLRTLTRAHENSLAELDRLDQALLLRAFTGQLVEQRPSEESSSILLQRLKSTPTLQEISAPMRKKRTTPSAVSTRSILEVLSGSVNAMTPEQVFQETGLSEVELDQVEKFYAELRDLSNGGKVRELRPDSSTVLLELVK